MANILVIDKKEFRILSINAKYWNKLILMIINKLSNYTVCKKMRGKNQFHELKRLIHRKLC